ncbi:hypothetical protein [Microbacterium sp. PMB16]|uniref:hypothetical protein n=1 Tax=Microbacterium sp. PMB16 TaxID=3120157 RepID=UPI003F4B6058
MTSGTTRPVLGIDVDGVLIVEEPFATAVLDHRVSAWGRWARSVQIPDQAASVLKELDQAFDIVWVSAWGHNAHVIANVLGVPTRPWDFLPVQFGKAEAIRDYAGGRPWALIHDGVDMEPVPDGGIVITVDPREGLARIDAGKLLEETLRSTSIVGNDVSVPPAHREEED